LAAGLKALHHLEQQQQQQQQRSCQGLSCNMLAAAAAAS
jgi:hypothetical protein